MMSAEERLAQASRQALARRARVKAGLGALRGRLAPSRLVADGKRHVEDEAKAVVAESKAHMRAHPLLAAAMVGGVAAWIFRKPLLRFAPPLARRAYDWLAGKLPFSEVVADSRAQDVDRLEPGDDLEQLYDEERGADRDLGATGHVNQNIEIYDEK